MERPLIFNNNDRPGIMLSSSIKKYIDFYGVKCGQKISLFTNNDTAYETAISLNNSGVNVNSVIDIRDKTSSLIVKQAEKLGIKIHWKSTVVNTKGYKRINKVSVMKLKKMLALAIRPGYLSFIWYNMYPLGTWRNFYRILI